MFIFSIFSINPEENILSTFKINRTEENGYNDVEQSISVKYYVACKLSISRCDLDMTQCPFCINNLAEVIKV